MRPPGIEPAVLNHYILLAVVAVLLVLLLLDVLSPTGFWGALAGAMTFAYISLLGIHRRR